MLYETYQENVIANVLDTDEITSIIAYTRTDT